MDKKTPKKYLKIDWRGYPQVLKQHEGRGPRVQKYKIYNLWLSYKSTRMTWRNGVMTLAPTEQRVEQGNRGSCGPTGPRSECSEPKTPLWEFHHHRHQLLPNYSFSFLSQSKLFLSLITFTKNSIAIIIIYYLIIFS